MLTFHSNLAFKLSVKTFIYKTKNYRNEITNFSIGRHYRYDKFSCWLRSFRGCSAHKTRASCVRKTHSSRPRLYMD